MIRKDCFTTTCASECPEENQSLVSVPSSFEVNGMQSKLITVTSFLTLLIIDNSTASHFLAGFTTFSTVRHPVRTQTCKLLQIEMAYCTWFVKWRLMHDEVWRCGWIRFPLLSVKEYMWEFIVSMVFNSLFQEFGDCRLLWMSVLLDDIELWRRIWKHQCCRRRVKSYTKPWLQVTSMYWDLPFSYPNHNSEPSRREKYLFFWTPTKTRSQQKQLRECCGVLRIRSLQEVKSKCIPCFA